MGKTSRTKGRDFQARIARWLTDITGLLYRSTQGLETTRGNMGDVRCEEDPRAYDYSSPGEVGLIVQCKKGKQPSVWKALTEADEAAAEHELPIAVLHRDQRKPGEGADRLVAMRPSVFARLLGNIPSEW